MHLLKLLPVVLLGLLVQTPTSNAAFLDIFITLSFESLVLIAKDDRVRFNARMDNFAQKLHDNAMETLHKFQQDGLVLTERMQKAQAVCQKLVEVNAYIAERENDLQDLSNKDVVAEMKEDSIVNRGFEKLTFNENWLLEKIATCLVCNWDQISMLVIKIKMTAARKELLLRIGSLEVQYTNSIGSRNDSRLRNYTTELIRCERANGA